MYRSICQSEGSDLVSIHSKAENIFVTTLMRRDPKAWFTWIGGYGCVVGGDCKWLDGSVWDYDNFKTGEPNNFDLDCLFMNYHYGEDIWWDGVCEKKGGMGEVDAICKMTNGAVQK